MDMCVCGGGQQQEDHNGATTDLVEGIWRFKLLKNWPNAESESHIVFLRQTKLV